MNQFNVIENIKIEWRESVTEIIARLWYIQFLSKIHKKDKHTRRGLVQLVSQRKKLLKYLSKTNAKSYVTLIKELSIRG